MGNLQESCLYRVNLTNGMIHTLVEGCQQGAKLKATHCDCSTLTEAIYRADQAAKKYGKVYALCEHCDFDAAARKEHGEE
ncbi:MAG: hypothetical protein V8Q82_02765 [Christensenellales bacterium]